VEILNADKDNHKAGDVVYRLPQDAADRIRDFLAMTGLAETQDQCEGRNVKRWGPLEECLQQIQRHALDLADSGPSNLLQIAQANIPSRPAAGQAIGFPIERLLSQGVPLTPAVYRVVLQHRPRRPNFDMGWDPRVLATSAVALTIAAHAVMHAGQSLLEIWVPKDRLMTDFMEDRLACSKDLYCINDDCLGQNEGANYASFHSPYCKKVSSQRSLEVDEVADKFVSLRLLAASARRSRMPR
jgi:hypothetical protein